MVEKRRAVDAVGPRTGHDVDDAARSVAEFGGIRAGQDLELAHGLLLKLLLGPPRIRSLLSKPSTIRLLATGRCPSTDSPEVSAAGSTVPAGGDAGRQRRQLDETPAVERQLLDVVRADDGGHGGLGGVDDGRAGLDPDALLDGVIPRAKTTSTSSPIRTARRSRTAGENPSCWARRSYSPGSSATTANWPSPSVVTSRTMLVARLRALIGAAASLNNVRGRLELPSLKEMEGLFVTEEGFVAEGVTSNIFWVKDGVLFTPAIETGILPGTTRAFIIECAKFAGITVNEGFY